MAYKVRFLFLAGALFFCWGCTQKSARLQKSIVPPDQTLFETGTDFLEKGHYIRARLALQTMISTYPDSEMTADAYFAVADTFFEEGGTTNWLQAEQQYKDFIIFFPAHSKAPDAQMKVIALYRKMVGDPARDQTPARKGEQEALQFLELYPDHDFASIVRNELDFFRDNLAQSELGVSNFYAKQNNYTAAIGRLDTILENYPNFFKTPEVLYKMAEYHEKNETSDKAEEYLSKLVSAYPFTDYSNKAKQKLTAMGKPIPEVDTEIAALNESRIGEQDGFNPLKWIDDFAKATGFKGPPDIYDQATEAVARAKAKAASAAEEAKGTEEGINIEEVIRK